MNLKVSEILSDLKIDERVHYGNTTEYKYGMDYLNKSIEDNIERIVDSILDEIEREDFLEEEAAQVALVYIGDLIAGIPNSKNLISDMASNLEDEIDRR